MVVAQKLKESEITEQDSLLLTRNLLRIAIFNISYIRGLFPEKYFNDKSVPALEMKIKKLMPMDAESRRLIDWMEKGVYDALQKKYLRTLLFCVCETVDGPMLEEYAFSFSYSNCDSQEVSMNINRIGSNKQGGAFKMNSNKEITPNQMRSSACKMVRTLIQLMRTLDKMPEERTIVMKLLYYDDVTPTDYEPPFFRGCTEEEAHKPWTKNPLKMEIGNVNSKHFVLALKVKSVLDPCEDENDENQDDAVSLGGDSIQRDEFSGSDSEGSHSDDDQYIVALRDKQQGHDDGEMADSDDTQDPVEDELAYDRVKGWIKSYHLDTVELTDVLSNFSDISVVLIEEIMSKLVKESFLCKAGLDCYTINKQKNSDCEVNVVKQENNAHPAEGKKSPQGAGEDPMYMKALYYALPLNYITVAKLQSELKEATRNTVSKLIEKMTNEGFVEATSNRRLGKRVIHSEITEKKLMEVRKILDLDTMDLDVTEPHTSELAGYKRMGNNDRDMSTCGILHSIGSDLTRSRGKAENHQNGSVRREQSLSGARDHEKTPTSRVERPIGSLESFAPGHEGGAKTDRNGNLMDEFDTVCSKSSQNKRNRKASTVKEPILQYYKRQKAQAV